MNTLRQIYEKTAPYGIEYNPTADTLTRIGDPTSHRVLPVQSQMKGVILDDLGNEVMELPYDDWTSIARDGSLGQVMVRIPEHWIKFTTRLDGLLERVWLSAKPITGFTYVPQYYVSAYEASLERSTLKLASVVNTTADFRGGNNNSAWDGTYRSLLGKPATMISIANFRTYARNRHNGDTRWCTYPYFIHRDLYWLYATEYASFNIQLPFSSSLSQDGFHQGGLGEGVTTWDETSWNNYNSYYPLIPCGVTDSLGNYSGVVSYTIKDSSDADLKTFSVPRWRGIENFFGDIWKNADGAMINVTSTANDVYICEHSALFSSSLSSSYSLIGQEVRSNGFVKRIMFGSNGDIFPTQVGGSATTWYCDYHYTDTSTNSLRCCLLGGAADIGTYAGFGCVGSSNVVSDSSARIGSRLCFIA